MGGLPAPAGMGSGDGSQTPAELVLFGWDRPTREALRGAVLADDPAGSSLGDPKALRQDYYGPTAALRG